MTYTTKDSGQRSEFTNGFVRDTAAGKPDFGLLLVAGVPYAEQPLTEEAAAMSRGAEKYSARNWERAFGDVPVESDEIERAKSSLLRHAIQLCCGESDEDHAAAVAFNARFVKMLRANQGRERWVASSVEWPNVAPTLKVETGPTFKVGDRIKFTDHNGVKFDEYVSEVRPDGSAITRSVDSVRIVPGRDFPL